MATIPSDKPPEAQLPTPPWYQPPLLAIFTLLNPPTILAILALNNFLQSLSSKRKVLRTFPAGYSSVLRTMPFISLADTLLLVLDFMVASCRRRSLRKAVYVILKQRREGKEVEATTHNKKKKKFNFENLESTASSSDRGDRIFVTLIPGLMLLVALTQAGFGLALAAVCAMAFMKLLTLPGLLWAKAFACMLGLAVGCEGILDALEKYLPLLREEEKVEGSRYTAGDAEKPSVYEAETMSEPAPWTAKSLIIDDLLSLMAFLVTAGAVGAQVLLWSYCLGPLGASFDPEFEGIMWPATGIPILTTIVLVCLCSMMLMPFTMGMLLVGLLVDVGLCLVVPAIVMGIAYGASLKWPNASRPVRWLADVFDVKTRSLAVAMAVPIAVGWSAFQTQALGFFHVSPVTTEWYAWSMGWADLAVDLAVKKETEQCAAGFYLLLITITPVCVLYKAVMKVLFDGSLSEGRPWKPYKATTQMWLKYALLLVINGGATLYHFSR